MTPAGDDVDPVAYNRQAWDREVARGNEWTQPVSRAQIARARAGDWSIVLIGHTPVDRSWFPADLSDVDVLCLASGGGQQGPILAAAGARVTVFDNSPAQLAQDRGVAEREGLALHTVEGDMRDLSAFAAAAFDVIVHPVSNLFAPEIRPVWAECYRVLRPGGLLLAGFMNPDLFVFDREAMETDARLVVRHPLPYSDLADLTAAERSALVGSGVPVEFSHTLSDQIGGQLDAGFVLTAFAEAPHHADLTRAYMPGYFATRAVKLP